MRVSRLFAAALGGSLAGSLTACAEAPAAPPIALPAQPPPPAIPSCERHDVVPLEETRSASTARPPIATFRLSELLAPTRANEKGPEVDLGSVSIPRRVHDVHLVGVTEKPRGPFVDVSPRDVEDVVPSLAPEIAASWEALRRAQRDTLFQYRRKAHFESPSDASLEARRCAARFVEDAARRLEELGAIRLAARSALVTRAEASWAGRPKTAGALFVWAYAREEEARSREPDPEGALEGGVAVAEAYEQVAGLAKGTRLAATATSRAARMRGDLGQVKEALALHLASTNDPLVTGDERAEAWLRVGELEPDPGRASDALSHTLNEASWAPLRMAAACRLAGTAEAAQRPGAALHAAALCARELAPELAPEMGAAIAEIVASHPELPEIATTEVPRAMAASLGADLAERALERMDRPALVAATEGARRHGADVSRFPVRAEDFSPRERATKLLGLLVEACARHAPSPRGTKLRVTLQGKTNATAEPPSTLATCVVDRAAQLPGGSPLTFRATLVRR